MVKTRNVYDPPADGDGLRLLVMRRWPRGIARNKVDAWDKDLGPSAPLLEKWRRRELDWDSFRREYEMEMSTQEEKLRAIAERGRTQDVTLLCGCKNEDTCHRSLLKKLIERLQR